MARYQLPGAMGEFNMFAPTLCARAMRHIALVGEIAQRDLMTYYRKVIGGGGQFTFAFERFCCRAAEDAIGATCSCEHAFTAANPSCLACYPREVVCRHHDGHLIARVRTPTGRDSADRKNRVRWIGREPATIVASLKDRTLTAAFEMLERQITPDNEVYGKKTVDLKDEERADLDAWIALVSGEIAARAGRPGRLEFETTNKENAECRAT